MTQKKLVAVGLLTENDLYTLGKGFDRCFPVTDDFKFGDLLAAIDAAEAAAARRPVKDRGGPAVG